MKVYDYVMAHAVRGTCRCGKCIDAGTDKQPEGHTADLMFFKVAQNPADPGDKDAFLAAVRAEFPHWLDGRERSYIELGGEIGDQGAALITMGYGALLNAWKLNTPANMLPMLSSAEHMDIAGRGFITIAGDAQ